jgi:hypothetical protein
MLMQARRIPPPVTQGMTMEKTATMLEAQAAVGMALTTGGSRRATARKMMAPYRRRVTADRNRLMRKARTLKLASRRSTRSGCCEHFDTLRHSSEPQIVARELAERGAPHQLHVALYFSLH